MKEVDTIIVKEQPELRHALAHMYYAIEALAKGNQNEALYELKCMEAFIFWEDDEHMTRFVEARNYGATNEKLQKKELQREKEER